MEAKQKSKAASCGTSGSTRNGWIFLGKGKAGKMVPLLSSEQGKQKAPRTAPRPASDSRPRDFAAGKSSGSKLEAMALTGSQAPAIPRPGSSMPLLWEKSNALEVHSTPVHLATRSLSARSSVSVPAASKHGGHSNSSGSRRKKTAQHASLRKAGSENGLTKPFQNHRTGSSKVPVVAGILSTPRGPSALLGASGSKSDSHIAANPSRETGSTAASGFNITSHLRQTADSSPTRSLSPEIDQVLQDINAVLRSPSADLYLGEGGGGDLGARDGGGGGVKRVEVEGESQPAQRRRLQKPVVAAIFSGVVSEEPVHSTGTTREGTVSVENGISSDAAPHDKGHPPRAGSPAAVSHRDLSDVHLDTAHQPHGPHSHSTGHSSIPSNSAGPYSIDAGYIPNPTRTANSGNPKPVPLDSNSKAAAVTKIQRWYRGVRGQQYREVQSLLQLKREELNRSIVEERHRTQTVVEAREQQEVERQHRRAVKMQVARRAAIEDLQKRREEKRARAEKIAQEEIALLQASGKIKRSKSHSQWKQQKRRAEVSQGAPRPASRGVGREKGRDASGGGEKRVSDDVIDKFFEAGPSRGKPSQPTPTPTPANAASSKEDKATRSTYADVLATLRLLEEEPPPLGGQGTGGEGSRGTLPASASYLSEDNLRRLESQGKPPPPTNLSEDKLQSILSYLDEMERADQHLLSHLSHHHPRTHTKTHGTPTHNTNTTSPPRITASQPQQNTDQLDLEAATAVASDVTATILAQRMELDNKTQTVEMLQKALSQQRELTVYHAKEMEKEGRRRLDIQRQEYEGTIQRHQCFIDQLIDDKKALSERCEQLVKELKEIDRKFKHKIKTMEESHGAELTQARQVASAAEKLRRERWRAEETHRIKETTVKSLEPEIQRIIAKGKAEIQKLKALHEAELLQADERASRRFVAQMEELRAQCAAEKEQACVHERELARQRYEKLAQQEEVSYQQQRRKLFLEVQGEKERLAEQGERQRAALERERREMEEAQGRIVEELREEHTRMLEETHRRHTSELKALEERLTIEKQAWEENYMKKQEAVTMTKEREIREAIRQERDKEIEMVIGRLEEETAESKAECERAAEARIRRIREKYEAELREVERSERSTLEKFNTMKERLTELEGEVSRLKSLLRQKEQEVGQVSEVAAKLTRERDNVSDIVRQEFADRLVATEEENKQLKIEMSELRARHRVEVERVTRGKEREMEEVHERVKQALGKKEENLRALRAQHEAALKRAEHLEMLLERQRKELLKK